ncbi:MAG: hypothetical protein ACPG9K_04560 [Poseidonibacter sp.]
METELLIHSSLRWVILLTLLIHLYCIYTGYFRNKPFTKFNRIFSHVTVGFIHLQFVIGLYVYYTSEKINIFLADIKGSMAISELRFFAVEHSLIMLIAIVIITIGSFKSKRIEDERKKYKTQIIYFTIGLVLILAAIPWNMS